MKDIVFEQTGDRNQFTFKDDDGTDFCFEYYPSIAGLWEDLDSTDFDVQLLIHPFLNNESNIFTLKSNIKTKQETIGYIFPVAVLDSNNFETTRSSDNNYLFVAYKVLLERLQKIDEAVNSLGACFEENICVCVLNLRTIGKHQGLCDCIHSLRKYGYSYFVENNKYKEIEGYTISNYKEIASGTTMYIDFSIPLMYSVPIIDEIIRTLPNADNIVYRFMLLYQIIEFLISKRISKSIYDAIETYQSSSSCSENDFLETVNNVRRERTIIKEIIDNCGIASLNCNTRFNNCCKHLYDLAGIVPQKTDEKNLFYSFRNQMIHSFRHLSNFKEELADTVFYYEQIVLTIVEKISYNTISMT